MTPTFGFSEMPRGPRRWLCQGLFYFRRKFSLTIHTWGHDGAIGHLLEIYQRAEGVRVGPQLPPPRTAFPTQHRLRLLDSTLLQHLCRVLIVLLVEGPPASCARHDRRAEIPQLVPALDLGQTFDNTLQLTLVALLRRSSDHKHISGEIVYIVYIVSILSS